MSSPSQWFDKSTTMNIGSWSEAKKVTNGRYVKSGPIAAGGHSWRIAFYPNGRLAGTTASMSLFLLLEDDDGGDKAKSSRTAAGDDDVVQVRFRFKMNPMYERSPVFVSGTVDAAFSRRRSNAQGFERFLSRDDFEKTALFKHNRFAIECGFTVFPPPVGSKWPAAVQIQASRSGRLDPSLVQAPPPVVRRVPPSAPPPTPTPTPSVVRATVPSAPASKKPSVVAEARTPPPDSASSAPSVAMSSTPPPSAPPPTQTPSVVKATAPPAPSSPKPSVVVTAATPPPPESTSLAISVTMSSAPPPAASPKPSVVTVATSLPDSTSTTTTSPAPSVATPSSPPPDSSTTTSPAPSVAMSSSPPPSVRRPDPLITVVVTGAPDSVPAGQTHNATAPLPLSGLPADLGRLLATKKASDVDLEVCGKVFAAHKSVLAARSPVFMEELFGAAKEEDTSYVLVIPDMRPAAFQALLHYLYTDTLPPEMSMTMNSPEEGTMLAEDLLAAADRYELKDLKVLTENKMCNHVGMSTVLPMLALAERYQCCKLKKMCLGFIGSCENTRAVMATDGLEILARSSPSVIKDVIAEILDAREAKS